MAVVPSQDEGDAGRAGRRARGSGAAPGGAERPARKDLKPLRRLVPFLRPYRPQITGALVALVIAALTVLGLGIGLKTMIDRGFATGDSALLDHALLVLAGVTVLMAGSSFARFFLVSWIGERVVADLRHAVYGRVIALSPGYYETTKTSEIISRMTTDTTVLQVVVGSSVSVFLRNLLIFFGGLAMLLITSPKLTGLVLLVVPLAVAPILIFGRRVRRLSRESQDRVADVGGRIDESLHAIRTVQAFTHEEPERRRFGGRVEEAFGAAVARIRARAFLTAFVILVVFASVGTVLWIGGRDVLAGRITGGDLASFVYYALLVAGASGAISEVIGDLQRAAGATERLFDLLDTEPEIRAPAVPRPMPEPAAGEVVFDQVVFRYPSRPDTAALQGFDLRVAPGEAVALVGPSGAGKTTVFQLLLRFYDPQAGRVSIDGVDLRDADPAAVRRRIGLVSQDPVVFSASARENIRYGRPDATDEEVREAARSAFALDFLEALPDGLDSFLGERGVRLSGGQRQRVAIARAILRDPAILLLDEATSALDAESEQAVQRALEQLMHGRTTLVIAHRLATVRSTDRIVVMEEGRVVDEGRHDALMARDGLYRRLATLQFDTGLGAGSHRVA